MLRVSIGSRRKCFQRMVSALILMISVRKGGCPSKLPDALFQERKRHTAKATEVLRYSRTNFNLTFLPYGPAGVFPSLVRLCSEQLSVLTLRAAVRARQLLPTGFSPCGSVTTLLINRCRVKGVWYGSSDDDFQVDFPGGDCDCQPGVRRFASGV